MMFKGASVDIKYHMARRGSERQPDFKEGVIETLTDIVQKRYNVAGKFLNLDRLSEDETFIAAGHRGFDQV